MAAANGHERPAEASPAHRIRILVGDSDPMVTFPVAMALERKGYTAVIAEDGEAALRLAHASEVHGAVIDQMLPKLDGLALIESLRRESMALPVIMVSAKHSAEEEVRCLRDGADDFLPKPFAMTRLLARLEAVLRRTHRDLYDGWLDVEGVTLNLLARSAWREGQKLHLQPREFSLLEVLMRNHGRVLSRAWLLAHLWHETTPCRGNVLDVLICRLRQKLDGEFPVKLLHSVHGKGVSFHA